MCYTHLSLLCPSNQNKVKQQEFAIAVSSGASHFSSHSASHLAVSGAEEPTCSGCSGRSESVVSNPRLELDWSRWTSLSLSALTSTHLITYILSYYCFQSEGLAALGESTFAKYLRGSMG